MKSKDKYDTLVAQVDIKNENQSRTIYRTVEVDGLRMFYREAVQKNEKTPNILLLHGFPSHLYRNLITSLAGKFHMPHRRRLVQKHALK